jgi:tyrosine-protein kinase Etk/Wzc
MNEASRETRFDVFVLIVRRWKLVMLAGFLGGAAGLTISFLLPKWYEARLAVVPSQRSQDASMALASKLPMLGLDGPPTDVQRIQAVLRSTSVADAVIEQFKLDERYETDHREATRQALAQHCSTSVDRKAGVVTLICEDTDPEQARAIAAYFGEVGNKVFGRVSVSSAREERKFLETQVLKARQDVDEASRKLRAFQEQHKIVDLPEQSKAVISAMASIQGDLLSKQLELSYLSSFSAKTEPSVLQLQEKIAILQSKLLQLEASHTELGSAHQGSANAAAGRQAGSAFFPGAMSVPELRFELEQLLRDQKIKETVFFLMTQRFETAKVDEARDTSTFQILDYPTLPTHKSRPRRMRAGILGGMVGLMLAGMYIVFPIWWRRRIELGSQTP